MTPSAAEDAPPPAIAFTAASISPGLRPGRGNDVPVGQVLARVDGAGDERRSGDRRASAMGYQDRTHNAGESL